MGLSDGAAKTQHIRDFRSGVFLRAVEHVGAGDLRLCQLVHLNVGAEGDDADQRVVGEIRKVLLQCVLQTVQLLRVHRGVDYDQEHGGDALAALDLVLHCCVRRHDFVGERGLVYSLGILGREVVSLSAERAGPKLRTEVNLAKRDFASLRLPVRIQIRTAIRLSATNRLIRKSGRHSVNRLQRRISMHQRRFSTQYKQAIGITHFVASMRVPGHVLNVNRIPSRSSASAIFVMLLFIAQSSFCSNEKLVMKPRENDSFQQTLDSPLLLLPFESVPILAHHSILTADSSPAKHYGAFPAPGRAS